MGNIRGITVRQEESAPKAVNFFPHVLEKKFLWATESIALLHEEVKPYSQTGTSIRGWDQEKRKKEGWRK